MTGTRQPWWLWPLLLALLPLVVVAGVLWLVVAVLLQLVVWLTWCPRGGNVLVVYSNSPIWQGTLKGTCSRLSAAGAQFSIGRRNTDGQVAFSGTVQVFREEIASSTHWPLSFSHLLGRRFRFYKAFKAFKHGRPEEAEKMRRELFELLDRLAPPTNVA